MAAVDSDGAGPSRRQHSLREASMETTVTGLFENAGAAQRAVHDLGAAGFLPASIAVITSDTADRHHLIGEETSDSARGAVIGVAVGGVGMAIGGIVMAVPPVDLFEMHPVLAALLFGALGALGGLVIGVLVGSATGHMVQEEYEHLIDNGAVLLAVNTDGAHAARAHAVLASAGGTMLSTSVHRKHRAEARSA
jgi:hypothetical protein